LFCIEASKADLLLRICATEYTHNSIRYIAVMQVLILEWCAGGDLNAESKIEASAVDEEFVWQVAAQLTLAVAHLHAQKMVHRDIKMGNVFLTGHGDIKVDPRTPRALR